VLLAIDTSAGTSVAIVDREAGVLSEHTVTDTRRHAEVIGTLIQRCLAESSVAVGSLSGVAIGMGPGPFTGLRVGIAAARTFAFGVGKPVVPVVSHDAVAFGHYGDSRVGPLIVVTDARRHEVYWSRYSGADEFGLPIRVDGPALARAEEFEPHSLRLSKGTTPVFLHTEWVSAASVGLLAERLYQHRRPFAEDQALYLRSPDVTISSGLKRVSR
jgi:tRNA threonylcarbamoyl adenosine modification protein YeaZ